MSRRCGYCLASALNIARERLNALRANFDAWTETTLSADFPS